MRPLIASLRPQEWVKNVLVFAGIVFSRSFDEPGAVADVLVTFVAFCAVSSAGLPLQRPARRRARPPPPRQAQAPDRERRAVRGHGRRRSPSSSPSSRSSRRWSWSRPRSPRSSPSTPSTTVLYSVVLKRLVIIDVMTIAGLFLLRVVAGAEAVDVGTSEFLLVCTAMLALFLGFTKRRQEAILEELPAAPAAAGGEPEAPVTRPVLEHYSLPFLDQMIAMVTATALISYIIYAVDSPFAGSKMLATAPVGPLRSLSLPLPDLRPPGHPLDGRDHRPRPGRDLRGRRLRGERDVRALRARLSRSRRFGRLLEPTAAGATERLSSPAGNTRCRPHVARPRRARIRAFRRNGSRLRNRRRRAPSRRAPGRINRGQLEAPASDGGAKIDPSTRSSVATVGEPRKRRTCYGSHTGVPDRSRSSVPGTSYSIEVLAHDSRATLRLRRQPDAVKGCREGSRASRRDAAGRARPGRHAVWMRPAARAESTPIDLRRSNRFDLGRRS